MDRAALESVVLELDEWFGEHAQIFGLLDDRGARVLIEMLHALVTNQPLVTYVMPPLQQTTANPTTDVNKGSNIHRPLLQTVERGHLEALVFALRTYMDTDECVCDSCIDPGCQGCMFCIAHSALVAIGYAEEEVQQEQSSSEP